MYAVIRAGHNEKNSAGVLVLYTVLLVDDEPWALKGLKLTLKWEKMGFKVIGETTSAKDAWASICKNRPDVVFSDIRMPEITGLEMLKLARERGLDTEFVIVSGFSDFSYAQEALRYSVFDYLIKPIMEEDGDKVLLRLKEKLGKKKEAAPKTKGEAKIKGAIVHNKGFKEILNYINDNYNKKLYLKELAEQFYLNPNYCCYLFRKHLGTSFSEYVTDLRMREAGRLFKDKSSSISDVARAVGYEDYYYFNKIFKRYYGITPLQYKKKMA